MAGFFVFQKVLSEAGRVPSAKEQRGSARLFASIFCRRQAKGFSLQSFTQIQYTIKNKTDGLILTCVSDCSVNPPQFSAEIAAKSTARCLFAGTPKLFCNLFFIYNRLDNICKDHHRKTANHIKPEKGCEVRDPGVDNECFGNQCGVEYRRSADLFHIECYEKNAQDRSIE